MTVTEGAPRARPARPGHRARVVFADLGAWDAFSSFAAALARRGVDVERVTVAGARPGERVRQVAQRAVFRRVLPVLTRPCGAAAPEVSAARDVLEGAAVVEAVDEVAAALRAAGALRGRRTADDVREQLLEDKLAMTRHAADLGLRVPPSWADLDDAPEPTASRPLVLKPRLGSGGQGVVVVASRAAARTAWAAGAGTGFVQAFLPGEVVHVGGVARGGRALVVAAYETRAVPGDETGPRTDVRLVEEPRAVDDALALLADLGHTGAFCLDLVRDLDGTPRLVDVNARVFGSWLGLQEAGLDLVSAYLVAHELPARASRAAGVGGGAGGAPGAAARALRRLRLLGPAYLALSAADDVVRRLRLAARRARAGGSRSGDRS